jgi:hypothetical protein
MTKIVAKSKAVAKTKPVTVLALFNKSLSADDQAQLQSCWPFIDCRQDPELAYLAYGVRRLLPIQTQNRVHESGDVFILTLADDADAQQCMTLIRLLSLQLCLAVRWNTNIEKRLRQFIDRMPRLTSCRQDIANITRRLAYYDKRAEKHLGSKSITNNCGVIEKIKECLEADIQNETALLEKLLKEISF